MAFHLYLLCLRTEALVASMLAPEEFGQYMAVGPMRHTYGSELFLEVDPEKVKDPFFDLAAMRAKCVPHADGRPKRSQYASVYRVLEHLPLSAFGKLHLVSRDGKVLAIDSQPYDTSQEDQGPNMYYELCPLTPMVVAAAGPAKFAKMITQPDGPVSVPRIFFADARIDRQANGALDENLPYRYPHHIEDCLKSLADGKSTKTVDRAPDLTAFFRTIRRGFFMGDSTGLKYYPFPTRAQLNDEYYTWWRSASMG